MKKVVEMIDEMVIMILSKNIDYDSAKYEDKETKLDVVKEKIESIEQHI